MGRRIIQTPPAPAPSSSRGLAASVCALRRAISKAACSSWPLSRNGQSSSRPLTRVGSVKSSSSSSVRGGIVVGRFLAAPRVGCRQSKFRAPPRCSSDTTSLRSDARRAACRSFTRRAVRISTIVWLHCAAGVGATSVAQLIRRAACFAALQPTRATTGYGWRATHADTSSRRSRRSSHRRSCPGRALIASATTSAKRPAATDRRAFAPAWPPLGSTRRTCATAPPSHLVFDPARSSQRWTG